MTVTSYVYSGHIVEQEIELSLGELSQVCGVNAEWLLMLVEEGILEPLESGTQWRFSGPCIQRVLTVQRLQRDLNINLPGIALALELLEENKALQARLEVCELGVQYSE